MIDSKINIINQLYEKASKSLIEHKLAAVIIKSNKMLIKPYCNSPKSKCNNINKGNCIGSIHAESNAILNYFGKSLFYDKNKNTVFFSNDKKKSKIDLVVIRINKIGELCNSRPCYNCLNLMKAVGIRKVYYSISSNELICENVQYMVSIQSSTLKILENKYLSIYDYYNSILKNNFPSIIKKDNLDKFIKYNLILLLPSYKVKIYNNRFNKYIICIYDFNNKKIIESKLIIN
jgi:deoxycytidylate deaminase